MLQFPSGPATQLRHNHVAIAQQVDVELRMRYGLRPC